MNKKKFLWCRLRDLKSKLEIAMEQDKSTVKHYKLKLCFKYCTKYRSDVSNSREKTLSRQLLFNRSCNCSHMQVSLGLPCVRNSRTCPDFWWLRPEIIFKNALMSGIPTVSVEQIIRSCEKYE